jgi:hypothetical protein
LGKVQAFKIDGLDLFFYSHDHKPPHFNAAIKSGEWEIRIDILLSSKENGLIYTAKYPRNPEISSKDKKQLLKLVLENRSKLLDEWEQKVCIKENR